MKVTHPRTLVSAALGALASFAACVSLAQAPLPHVSQVDLDRFMGRWYVIASIPTRAERAAFNAVETYERASDGTIRTTFTFNKGRADGPLKRMTPTGFVRPDSSNALWDMQFIWPIKSEYVIAHVDAAYTETIVARTDRDYVWIMARTPRIRDADYTRLVIEVLHLGYDISKLRKVPQTANP